MVWRERPPLIGRTNRAEVEDWCERAEAAIEAAEKGLEAVRAARWVEEAQLQAGIALDAIRLLAEADLKLAADKMTALALADRAAFGLGSSAPRTNLGPP